tara:strand:+ start:3178 stop:3909 length:732 start_codon:yes stop_codon:yes gene_type:complete
MQLIKELNGHSGASVSLYDNNTVVKNGYKKARQSADILLSLPFKTPEIYEVTDESIVMEYVNGEDIASFLEQNGNEGIDLLIGFIEKYYSWCFENSTTYNFGEELDDKAFQIADTINLASLTNKLKYDMPKSMIHGDFTFDNMLHKDGEFYLIDANPTNLSSIYFDGAKLRQDIDGFWFLRSRPDKINFKISCKRISEHLKSTYAFMNDDNLYCFMLCRILPYCKDDFTIKFLTKEIDRIWPL